MTVEGREVHGPSSHVDTSPPGPITDLQPSELLYPGQQNQMEIEPSELFGVDSVEIQKETKDVALSSQGKNVK